MRAIALLPVPALAAASLTLGCAQPEAPLSPDPNEGETFMGSITAADGGSVASSGDTITVEVPPGAVEGPLSLTISVRPGTSETLTSIYELGPTGQTFAHPVSISIALGDGDGSDERTVLAWRDGDTWRPIPGSRLVDGRILATTRHFSAFAGWALGEGEPVYPWTEGDGDESAMTYWTYTDASTGLTWQMPSAVRFMSWDDAVSYCASLDLDGGGWHLPNIDELRTLVRDCAATAPGGSCGVTESCLELYACFVDDPTAATSTCNGCEYPGCPEDPTRCGCHWDPSLFYTGESSCSPPYWSSSSYHIEIPDMGPGPDDGLLAWTLGYAGAGIAPYYKTDAHSVRARCVR